MATGQQATCYVDPDTGHTMMPGTRRPDGTWRKPRRVKEGYTPQDEVPLYESKGKLMSKARAEGYIPGLPPPAPITDFKIDMFVVPPPIITIPGLSVEPTPPTNASTSSKVKKKKNKNPPLENGLSEVTSKMASAHITSVTNDSTKRQQPVATDPAKKLRNLRKKMRDIEALEKKLQAGDIENPEKEQLDKVAKKAEVANEIAALEKTVE